LMKLYILPPLVHYLKTIMRKLKKLWHHYEFCETEQNTLADKM
jgi:hypothetical protein